MRKHNGKVLRIDTSFPTFKEVPKANDKDAEVFEVSTKTSAGWPDNWHQLPAKWKAVLLRELVNKVIIAMLSGHETEREETIREFTKLMRWAK